MPVRVSDQLPPPVWSGPLPRLSQPSQRNSTRLIEPSGSLAVPAKVQSASRLLMRLAPLPLAVLKEMEGRQLGASMLKCQVLLQPLSAPGILGLHPPLVSIVLAIQIARPPAGVACPAAVGVDSAVVDLGIELHRVAVGIAVIIPAECRAPDHRWLRASRRGWRGGGVGGAVRE